MFRLESEPHSPATAEPRNAFLEEKAFKSRTVLVFGEISDVAASDIARRMVSLHKVPAADLGERWEQYHDLCVGFQWRLSLGETEGAAEEACRLLEVEYEPLPTVFDPELAMEPGAPILHENAEQGTIGSALTEMEDKAFIKR